MESPAPNTFPDDVDRNSLRSKVYGNDMNPSVFLLTTTK